LSGLMQKFDAETELSTQLKFEAAQESPAVAMEFFEGQLRAEKVVELSGQMSVRAKMFCCIASGWREVERFDSTDELHAWLYSQQTASGQKYIPQPSQGPSKDPVDSQKREVRKVCQLIGLQFQR